MIISSKENAGLYEVLFKNWENYEKWAPYFQGEFLKEQSETIGRLAGFLLWSILKVDDACSQTFFEWLKNKGVPINR